jgi:hypothetical protein
MRQFAEDRVDDQDSDIEESFQQEVPRKQTQMVRSLTGNNSEDDEHDD